MCNQPHGQQLAEVGAAGGRWGEGALPRVGFREDICRMGAFLPGRRGVALWGGVDLPEVPPRGVTATDPRCLWLLCCHPRTAESLQEGD